MKYTTKLSLALAAGVLVMQSTPAIANTFEFQGSVSSFAYKGGPAAPPPPDFTIGTPFSVTYKVSNNLVDPLTGCSILGLTTCYYIDDYSITMGSRTFIGKGGFETATGDFSIDLYTTIADPQYGYRQKKSHLYFFKNEDRLGAIAFGETAFDVGIPPNSQFVFDGDPDGGSWFGAVFSSSDSNVSSPVPVFEPNLVLGLGTLSIFALTRSGKKKISC